MLHPSLLLLSFPLQTRHCYSECLDGCECDLHKGTSRRLASVIWCDSDCHGPGPACLPCQRYKRDNRRCCPAAHCGCHRASNSEHLCLCSHHQQPDIHCVQQHQHTTDCPCVNQQHCSDMQCGKCNRCVCHQGLSSVVPDHCRLQ